MPALEEPLAELAELGMKSGRAPVRDLLDDASAYGAKKGVET